LENNYFKSLENLKTNRSDTWTILRQEFHGDDRVTVVKLQTLRREFETIFMKGNESDQDFFSRISIIINQMRTYGENISNQKVVEKILRSLQNKFDNVVTAIEESKDMSIFSLNELMGSILAHENR
ncbi:UBN2 domain-containing protein, partial [Cephalotus follicularis]